MSSQSLSLSFCCTTLLFLTDLASEGAADDVNDAVLLEKNISLLISFSTRFSAPGNIFAFKEKQQSGLRQFEFKLDV